MHGSLGCCWWSRVLILSTYDDSAENFTPEHNHAPAPAAAFSVPVPGSRILPFPSSDPVYDHCEVLAVSPMYLARLQGPLQRAAGSSSRSFSTVLRPTTTATTTTLEERFTQLRIASPAAINSTAGGRRYASTKSQGAYKLKSKKTIPKKMGAKKTGGASLVSNWMPTRRRHPLLTRCFPP
jgi:hypothetical protein